MPTTESNSILNTLFGCCLGWRQGWINRGENGSSRDENGADERTPLISGDASNAKGSAGANSTGALSGAEGDVKPALYSKKNVDVARLKAIRDEANDAFFHIDTSQMLPSSSSSRPMNASSSQLGRGQRREHAKDNKRHQSLIAESDKAERLYRAALVSPAHSEGRPFAIDGVDDDDERGDKSSSKQLEHRATEGESPLGLVRQMRVSIREAPERRKSNPHQGSPKLVRKLSSSPHDPSTSKDDAREEATLSTARHSMEHHPSLHSLRTLRLSVASNNSPSLSSEIENTDEEDWNQRGRTRSKRGLAWMDVGQSRDVTQKPKLDEIFKGAQDVNESSKAKAILKSNGDEVPNALRLSSKQSEVANKISDRLKAMSPITAELFDGNNDST